MRLRHFVLAIGAGIGFTAGCFDPSTKDCPTASEGCACSTGGACDAELVCLSGLCVSENGTEGDGDGDPTGDGDGDPTGDGDGDPGDGDGDPTGDGDGDPTGDGDGDPTGDGDGAPSGCGWVQDADPPGYYCGAEGTDPTNANPIACPDGLVEGDPCGTVTGAGCCDRNGDNWYCADDGQDQFLVLESCS